MKAVDQEREINETEPTKEISITGVLRALFQFWKWLTR